ncbi:circularly permuted type 2 ATP-grasp protein [Baekduia soli]|uniref:circularly permuted type 2 ATP-grasp protein n=1 Tax=Baekduia soli TaxID=496014 RepID=UPI001E50B563|nr:circularly permuted type 2 ATP-grasp protein [Baekduia soli]
MHVVPPGSRISPLSDSLLTDDAPGYEPPEGSFDEIFGPHGVPRGHAAHLAAELHRLGPEALAGAGRRRDAIFMQQGITFDASGEDGPVRDRPFPLDLVPRILPASEWDGIKRGLAQRIRALNRFIDDVYHEREIVRAGLVPWRLIVSRSHFARAAHGVRPPGGVYCHVAGCDLVRDADGSWRVLEDNVRTPSGISYVLENRVAMTRLVPQLFRHHRVRPVDHYPQLLLGALRSVAPSAEDEATVVVWTPGPMNSAYFEHAFLARQMGVELVEASDLVVRDDVLYMRTTAGLRRVHAVYRHLDDDFVDPLEFRPDSLLGVPGLVRAYRAGTVAIANALGTGVADDKAIYHYVPDMIRFYLSEEPILANVHTYLLADPDIREAALARRSELVFKPTGESGGKGVFIGPQTDKAALDGLADVIRARPERWIAQELVQLSTVPTAMPDGTLAPRHVDLRPFAVFGETIRIVPGGLTRVALTEGSMIVNSSRGGGSKDTWVLEEDGPDGAEPETGLHQVVPTTMPGLRYGGEWQGQQQQQQQSQPADAHARSRALRGLDPVPEA